jgi:hypothetical protein
VRKAPLRSPLLKVGPGLARKWIEDLRLGRVASLAEIADRESLGERYVRLLVPLAFVAPRIVAAIADGTAPTGLRRDEPRRIRQLPRTCVRAHGRQHR